MKRMAFLLSLALMVPAVAFSAKKEKAPKALKTVNYENVKIYAQSGRNSQKRGSAVSLIDGRLVSSTLMVLACTLPLAPPPIL